MTKTLYIVRHCKAEGQRPEAALTSEGQAQAEALADFLTNRGIHRIISSPFQRARQSIAPLTERLRLPVETDARLVERVLSDQDLPDWLDRLRETFEDMDLSLKGGESSRVAMERATSAVRDMLKHQAMTTAVVTHGNLMVLLLKHFDDRFDFEDWKKLTNPDVFRVTVEKEKTLVERIWR